MTRREKNERRTGALDRRLNQMDRRQFIDIGWEMESERRVSTLDRRKGLGNRRRD